MRLSDAILLGDSLKKCDSSMWLSDDGSCGCALGGALLAAGVSAAAFHKEFADRMPVWYSQVAEMDCIKKLWPWLTGEQIGRISDIYSAAEYGLSKTVEDVADYVRTIEPAEEEYIPDPRDEEPWSDTQTRIEQMNSIKGR